jgi:hypothetical protein
MARITLLLLLLGAALSHAARADCRLGELSQAQLDDLYGHFAAVVQVDSTRYDDSTTQSLGSGFLLSYDGRVITAKHAVPDASSFKSQKITVYLGASVDLAFEAFVEGVDLDADLVVLRLKPRNVSATHFQNHDPVLSIVSDDADGTNADVAVLGYPVYKANVDGKGHEPVVRCGNIDGADDSGPWWYTSATMNFAVSGGPLLAKGPALIGVAEGQATSYDIGDDKFNLNNVFLAVRGSFVSNLVKKLAPDTVAPGAAEDLKKDLNDYNQDKPVSAMTYQLDIKSVAAGSTLLPNQPALIPTTFVAPAGGVIASCDVVPAAPNATCDIDKNNNTATINVKLEKTWFLSVAPEPESFAGTASIKVETAQPAAP